MQEVVRNLFGVYGRLSSIIFIMTGILYGARAEVFSFFLGNINPIYVIISLSTLGSVMVGNLEGLGLQVYSPLAMSSRIRYFFAAIVLALIMISIDYYVVFPESLNIVFPYSLLYYPVFGYIVEVLFHITPVVLLLLISRRVFGDTNNNIIAGIIVIASILEPLFQMNLGFSSQVPLWTSMYVGLNIFLINLIQLKMFWKQDFVSMYAFRLVYYLFWHIIWGVLRLHILF